MRSLNFSYSFTHLIIEIWRSLISCLLIVNWRHHLMMPIVRATLECRGGYTVTWLTEGKTRVWIISLNTIKGISPDRGENQREKSKVSPLPVSPYHTTLSCAQTHYLVRTDPMLRGPLTNSRCMYASYFTSAVNLEVKVEWSSDLGVGWNLEKWKCEMGHPLTPMRSKKCQ